MIRTQVYLPKTDIDFLKDLASVNKSTMSGELRKVIKIAKSKFVDNTQNYAQRLLTLKGNWFKSGEWENVRKELDEGLLKPE